MIGIDPQAHLMTEMLEEQRKTNQLLAILIEVLTDEDSDSDDTPATYLDGSPLA